MKFRLGTFISTLAVAFLFYAAMTAVIFHKIETLIFRGGISGSKAANDDHRTAFIVAVNISVGWLALSIILTLRRRANRYRAGFCGGCGRRLALELIRCPQCGERRAGIGSTEPLFPVILPREQGHSGPIPCARPHGPISR
jgi:hypothetical protein